MFKISMLTKEDKKYIENTLEERLDKKFEELAIFIQRGFQESRLEIKDLEKRVNKRFDDIDRRIDILEYKVIGGFDRRLDTAEDNICHIKKTLKLI